MNLLDHLPIEGAGTRGSSHEQLLTLVERTDCRIERIVSQGHVTPDGQWYDQDGDEWVLVVTGKAKLELAEPAECVMMTAGDYRLIPAHRRHRVAWTDAAQPTIWLAIHWPPRTP